MSGPSRPRRAPGCPWPAASAAWARQVLLSPSRMAARQPQRRGVRARRRPVVASTVYRRPSVQPLASDAAEPRCQVDSRPANSCSRSRAEPSLSAHHGSAARSGTCIECYEGPKNIRAGDRSVAVLRPLSAPEATRQSALAACTHCFALNADADARGSLRRSNRRLHTIALGGCVTGASAIRRRHGVKAVQLERRRRGRPRAARERDARPACRHEAGRA